MASWFDQFPSRLGLQMSPYGFAPSPPGMVTGDPAAGAGMQFLGDMGMQMLANSRANPVEALGQAYGGAKEAARERSKDAFIMQQAMADMEEKRRAREAEAEQKRKRAEFLMRTDPQTRAMLEAYPELADDYFKATTPAFQKAAGADNDPYYGTLVPLKDKDGNFAGWGQARKSGGIDPAKVGGEGLSPMSPYERSFETNSGATAGKAPAVVSEEYVKKVRPEMRSIAETASTLRQAREFLDKGIETGSGADTIQALRSLGSKLGFEVDESVLSNTQTYQNFIGNVVIPRMAALGGNDSNEELRKLYSLSGGDISQSLAALRNTLTFMESLMGRKFGMLQKDEQSALQLLPGLEPVQNPFAQSSGGGASNVDNDPLGIRGP